MGKVVLFVQKWLFSVKSGCIQAKEVVFRLSGCLPANWLCSGKLLYPGKSVCIGAKRVVFGQKSCDHTNVVVCGQSGLYRA